MFFGIFHKMREGHVITYKPSIIRIIYLQFLGDAGTYKSKFVADPQFLMCVNSCTHQRALYGEQFGQQLRNISFYISDNSRTGLRDASCEVMLFYIIDISPCSNVSTERNAYDVVNTHRFQPAKHL